MTTKFEPLALYLLLKKWLKQIGNTPSGIVKDHLFGMSDEMRAMQEYLENSYEVDVDK